MNNQRIFNIVSAGIAAVIAVSSLCIYECGSTSRIGLQSPSLLGAGKVDFFERQLMDDDEIAETGVVPMSLGNPNISINDSRGRKDCNGTGLCGGSRMKTILLI